MFNYLNNYDNLNGCSLNSAYIFMKNVPQKCISYIYLTGKFSKLCAQQKKKVTMVSKHTLIQISTYLWLTGQYMLPY